MSSLIRLEIKPIDNECDLSILEQKIWCLILDGVKWGSAQTEEMCYGLHKLLIDVIVRDDVGEDDIIEAISSFGDYVQSVDVASMTKM
jgi:translation elongation factor EF-1beta